MSVGGNPFSMGGSNAGVHMGGFTQFPVPSASQRPTTGRTARAQSARRSAPGMSSVHYFHANLLKANTDLAHLMNDCEIGDLIGLRVSTWYGRLLQDRK